MRFLFVDVDPAAPARVALAPEARRRLRKVLRLAPGDPVDVVDRARLAVGGDALEVGAWEDLPPDPHPDLVLAPALIKSDRLEWAAQRCFELGLRGLAPVVSARVVARRGDRFAARLHRVAEAAGEQSGRVHLPEIAVPAPLEDVLVGAKATGRRVYLAAPGSGEGLPDLALPALLLVGPEGGFAPEEVAAVEAAGGRRVGLGGHVLRAETAQVALTTLALDRAGWFRSPRGEGDPSPGR